MNTQAPVRRLAALRSLLRPLAFAFVGIVLLSLGVGYVFTAIYRNAELPTIFFYLTLQFLPIWQRAILFLLLGVAVLAFGVWQLSSIAVIPLGQQGDQRELLVGLRKPTRLPRIVVLSGGAGIFILNRLGPRIEHMMCVTPVQDPVEYYYRALGMFSGDQIEFVPPTPFPAQIIAELDDSTLVNIKELRQMVQNPTFAKRHIARLALHWLDGAPGAHPLARVVADAIADADAVVLGPGSLFEGIVPNLLIDELRKAISQTRAAKIYVCNLMTEPGMTTGFTVSDHIRTIKEYGGFTPNYVLVNAQRIEPEIRTLYEAANQSPVYLEPEAYEETVVLAGDEGRYAGLLVEGAVVLEADLASALVQSIASLERPGEVHAFQVLRHDPDKLAEAILAVLRRE